MELVRLESQCTLTAMLTIMATMNPNLQHGELHMYQHAGFTILRFGNNDIKYNNL